MIKDITIGQFFPGNSLIHKLDPRAKILLTFIFIIALFLSRNFFSLGLLFTTAIAAILVSRISFRVILKGLRMIVVLVVFTGILQLLYNDKGDILWKPFEQYDFAVTEGGVFSAVFIIFRIIALILFSSLLTYTTSPTMLTDAIERLLSPLKLFKINVNSLAMMMTIALRFIPTLIEEINIIMSAQKARGADLETGSFTQRVKALVPVFIPLIVNSFRRAYELAFAMECRCYTGNNKRTRMKKMKFSVRDYLVFVVVTLLVAAVIYTSYFDVYPLFIFERVV
ncbi:MAG: energy-coupling factor transporter transmembrane protein EcfT [Ruminococcaceae bacterium]|nr:energy-coupling factor transporter transmembrane protein EcfT [Oscillospiraceae bacterium]MBR3595967.1 energy-coupling factor transporter transmembrane protein EcfT [Clostridia bacterium]